MTYLHGFFGQLGKPVIYKRHVLLKSAHIVYVIMPLKGRDNFHYVTNGIATLCVRM